MKEIIIYSSPFICLILGMFFIYIKQVNRLKAATDLSSDSKISDEFDVNSPLAILTIFCFVMGLCTYIWYVPEYKLKDSLYKELQNCEMEKNNLESKLDYITKQINDR